MQLCNLLCTSTSPLFETVLDHITCFGQCDISEHKSCVISEILKPPREQSQATQWRMSDRMERMQAIPAEVVSDPPAFQLPLKDNGSN